MEGPPTDAEKEAGRASTTESIWKDEAAQAYELWLFELLDLVTGPLSDIDDADSVLVRESCSSLVVGSRGLLLLSC